MAEWADEYYTMLDDCEKRESRLTDWERGFVESMRGQLDAGKRPTRKQIETLEQKIADLRKSIAAQQKELDRKKAELEEAASQQRELDRQTAIFLLSIGAVVESPGDPEPIANDSPYDSSGVTSIDDGG